MAVSPQVPSAPSSISVASTIVDNEVADVEMLLEAYYMHIDATFNRLEVRAVLNGESTCKQSKCMGTCRLLRVRVRHTPIKCCMTTCSPALSSQTLNEYIKDTEDMVSIKLDQHRNALITVGAATCCLTTCACSPFPRACLHGTRCARWTQVDLVLTALTACLAIVTAITGVFGMNLQSGLEEVGAWGKGKASKSRCAGAYGQLLTRFTCAAGASRVQPSGHLHDRGLNGAVCHLCRVGLAARPACVCMTQAP